jgi:hypothetical protein
MNRRVVVACVGSALLMLSAGFAHAIDLEPGSWAYGFYAGAYLPDPSELDSGATGGARIGYLASDHVALSASAGYTDLDGSVGSGASKIKGTWKAYLLDLNVWYILFPEKRFSFTIGAGPGYAWNDLSLNNNASNNVSTGHQGDDSLTFNVALGPVIKINDRINLRLMTRFRYFDERDNDETDREITLGIAFPLKF